MTRQEIRPKVDLSALKDRFPLIYDGDDEIMARPYWRELMETSHWIYLVCAAVTVLANREGPVEKQRRIFRQIVRDAKKKGYDRAERRIFFDLLQPRGSTSWKIEVAPRPMSSQSMPPARVARIRARQRDELNSLVAGEILRRFQGGMTVREAREELADTEFFGLDEDGIEERWQAWRGQKRFGRKPHAFSLTYDESAGCFRASRSYGLGGRRLPKRGRPRKRR